MGFSITATKTKAALQAKTKAAKKHQEHQVVLAAMAATLPEGAIKPMEVERRSITDLKANKKRARKTTKKQVKQVAQSIKQYGQVLPVLINQEGEILDGHIVVEALKALKQPMVWCGVINHLEEHEQAALHITLNRLQECGEWDLDALAPLMIALEDFGFDLESTGFSLPEIDIITSPTSDDEDKAASDQAEDIAPPSTPVSKPGDLWLLGKHRLLCGDAAVATSYQTVLDGAVADCVFTDAPWNIPIAGFVSGLGKTKHGDFLQGVGEMSDSEFRAFCEAFHQQCHDHMTEGAAMFSCIDWRSVDVVMDAGRKAGFQHINTAVWNKGSGGMGVPYRSAHELVVVFRKGAKLAVNNVELGKHGRDRTNVWSYPGANKPGSSANEGLKHHPTAKPVPMVADALLDITKRGAVVLDPFMGSGTTILAAQKSGRRACGIELDPRYVDVAIRRWEALTGEDAVHSTTGLTFAQTVQQQLDGDPAVAA